MAKKRKAEEAIDTVVAELTQENPFLIVQGTLNDEHCNFGMQRNTGDTKGMVDTIKGKPLIVHDDLRNAFLEFRPHLAALCDRIDGDEENFDAVANHPNVDLYNVTGFKIKGAGEAESISLIGSFHSMTAEGRHDVTTAPVSLEGDAGYRWYNELRDTADKVRMEIELYNKGKCTPAEEEYQEKPQAKIEFSEGEEQI